MKNENHPHIRSIDRKLAALAALSEKRKAGNDRLHVNIRYTDLLAKRIAFLKLLNGE